jgi:hypothetical protein
VNALHTTGLFYEDIDWIRHWQSRDTGSPVKSSSSPAPASSLLFVLLLVVICFPSTFNHTIELSAQHNTQDKEESEDEERETLARLFFGVPFLLGL